MSLKMASWPGRNSTPNMTEFEFLWSYDCGRAVGGGTSGDSRNQRATSAYFEDDSETGPFILHSDRTQR